MIIDNPLLLMAALGGAFAVTAVAYLVTTQGAARTPPVVARRVNRLVDRHLVLATGLGLSSRDWLVIRVAVPAFGLLLSLVIFHLPIAIDVLVLVAFGFGLPWMLEMVALRRQTRMEAEFVGLMSELQSRITQKAALNDILVDFGKHPPPGLEPILHHLADDRLPLMTNLRHAGEASRSVLVRACCALLMLSQRRDQTTFASLVQHNIVPYLADLLRMRRRRQTDLSYQRGVIMIMAGVCIFFFLITYALAPTYRDVYQEPVVGTVLIAVVVLVFMGLSWLVSVVMKPEPETDWDLVSVQREVEAIESR